MVGEIFEALMELLLEGAIEGSKSSRIPKPVRIILKLIVCAVYTAVLGLFILMVYISFRDGNTGMGVFMLVLTILFILAVYFKIIKRKR